MYNEVVKKLVHLTHDELVELKGHVNQEIIHRQSLNPIAWRCPECKFEGPYGEVYYHLTAEHPEAYQGGMNTIHAPQEVYA
jgi:hypothetical protein